MRRLIAVRIFIHHTITFTKIITTPKRNIKLFVPFFNLIYVKLILPLKYHTQKKLTYLFS